MSAEEAVKSGAKKKTKTLKLVVILAAIFIAVAVFGVPWFVSSEKGRQMILAKINGSINGKVDFAGLTMSWWRGIKVTGIGFDDSAGRISARVKQVTTKPHYGSILTGSISLGRTEILEPRVEVNLAASQTQQQRVQNGKGAAKESRPIVLPIKGIEMIVRNGDLKVTDAKAEAVELSRINSQLNFQGLGKQTDFDVDLAVVDKGKESEIKANGQIVPGRGWKLEKTSGVVAVEVNDLELGSLASIFAMAGIEFDAKGTVSGSVDGEIREGRLEKVKADVEGRDLDVDTVRLTGGRFKTSQLGANVQLARAEDMINIESFNVKSDWFSASGRGTAPTTFSSLDEFLKTDAHLSGSFELDTAQLFTQMPRAFRLKEGVKVTSGILRGDIETLTDSGKRKLNGRVNLERLEGAIGGKTITLSEPVQIEAEIASEKRRVSFDKLGLSSAFAKFNCSGTMELFKYRGDVDLAKFQAELGQFVNMRGYGIAGELSGEGEIAIKESKFIVGGSTVVKNLKVNYPGKLPFEQREVSAVFDAEVDSTEKAIIVKKFQIESDQIKIQGRFSKISEGEKTKVESRAECEYEWAAVSTIAAPLLPAGLVLEGHRKDTISFASKYPKGQDDKLLENLNAKAKMGFAKGSFHGLNFGQTEADVQIENGLLKVAPFSTAVNNGQLNFAGEANFKQKPTLLKTPGPIQVVKDVQINDEVARELLMYLNPVFANAVRVSGVANFECEKLAIPLAGGDKNDIEVAGTISMNKLRLETSDLLGQILSVAGVSGRGVDITIHPTKFILQDGFLRYDDMQMDVGNNPVNFRGVIGLDKSLNMSVTLPYTTKGETVRIGKEVEGVRISLPLKGTVDKPELDLGKLLEEQLKQQLKERLKEELDGLFKK